jgi:16S rRNA (adenine1518-N6/adenine1519-N6)-dimethyltransferase
LLELKACAKTLQVNSRTKPIKALGQHFLVNAGVVSRIADIVFGLSDEGRSAILEIGPGPGALTRELLSRGLKVLSFEIDPRMAKELESSFATEISAGAFKVFRGDALELPWSEMLKSFSSHKRWVICGNLPYNVGAAIVFRSLEDCPEADKFCFMLQKEVVLRFISDQGGRDYGMPTLKMSWATKQLGHFWVKPGSFAPPPKVDSGVFWFERLRPNEIAANPLERGGRYDLAAAFASKLFQRRRKMIRNSIKETADTKWGDKRPEEVSPKDHLMLAQKYGGVS